MLLGMIFRLYSENFVEIKALFPEILRFEFVTLFVKHPVDHVVYISMLIIIHLTYASGLRDSSKIETK